MANDSLQLIKNIQELICLLEYNFEDYQTILDEVNSEIVKNSKHCDAYVSFINTQLSKADSRKKGLILLRSFLPFCSNEILEEETISWLNNSLKVCKNEGNIQNEAYIIIKFLLEISYKSPDLNRNITSGTLNKIIEIISKTHYNSEDSINALKCLEICLRLYSGSCLPFKTTIENFILTYVDCSVSTSIQLAGRCFLAFQQIGGGGTKGINYKEAWRKQQLNLCATIHSLMDEVFESIIEIEQVQDMNYVLLLLPKLPIGNKNKLIFNRINNLLSFLQEMLLGAFPVAKSIFPQIIINLISRGLAITRETLGLQILNEALSMSSQLVTNYKKLIQLLQALIVGLGCNLLPYGYTICKLINNSLKITKPKDAGSVEAFCDLRITSYQTLSLWISTTQANCVDSCNDLFIPIIINDITPYINELNLRVQKVTPKHMSKKSKKKMQHDQITHSELAKNYAPSRKFVVTGNVYQNKICCMALKSLQVILNNCGYFLKLPIHKQLQEFVIKTLFNIQRGNIVNPYNDVKCKLELYKTLMILVINHQSNIPPPIEYAVQLFSKAQTDENSDIAQMCSTALSNLNAFIHPPFPTLQFSLDLDQLRIELNIEKEKNDSCIIQNGELEEDIMIVETIAEINDHEETNILLQEEKNITIEKDVTVPEEENKTIEDKWDKNNIIESAENKAEEREVSVIDLTEEKQIQQNPTEDGCKSNNESKTIEETNIRTNENFEKDVCDSNVNDNSEDQNLNIDLDEEDMISSFIDLVNE